ncbi:hypothetical protein V6B16_10085 [Salinimicrobium catena]|uniref:hypothetical protein n=1 Tax=Salinimicrobium catena TaxID=390640 RepID=UPI002FE4B58E
MGQDTDITMQVDTKNINKHNVDSHVTLTDNRSNKQPSKDPKNFTSQISKGKKVTWSGNAGDESDDTIQITNITKKETHEPELLQSRGKGPDSNGKYKANVKDEFIKGVEGYYIEFTINHNKHPVYRVDPKLAMEEN